MKTLLKICFVVLVALLMATPFVHATSLMNVSGMNTAINLLPFSTLRYFSQSFTTLGDGLNLTTIVLPLTKWAWNVSVYGAYNASGPLTVQILPTSSEAYPYAPDFDSFPICQTITSAVNIPVTLDRENIFENVSEPGYVATVPSSAVYDIYWLTIPFNPTLLAPNTRYCLVISEEWTPYFSSGLLWWGKIGYVYGSEVSLVCDPPGSQYLWELLELDANRFSLGFQLLETSHTFTALPIDANLIFSLFLSLGLGCVGFGMTKGKEPIAAIFLIEFGIIISYLMGWLPTWILGSSFALLGIMLAYKFRGVLSHG